MNEINIAVARCTECGSTMEIRDAWVEDGTGVIEADCTNVDCGEIVLIKVSVDPEPE